MSSSIVQRVLDDGTDMKVQLSNSQFARKHSLQTGWTHCRLGIRWQANDLGVNTSGTPRFYLGLCNGSGNLFFDTSTDNFLGVVWEASTWTFTAGASYFSSSSASEVQWYKKQGTTSTAIGNFITTASTVYSHSSGNQKTRSVLFIDIEKTGTNVYTVSGLIKNNTVSGDVSTNSFFYQMTERSPVIGNHGVATRRTFNDISEITGGAFNHFCCGWNKIVPEIEVSEIAVVDLS